MRIIGIDLAWGERQPDGLALIETSLRGGSTLQDTGVVSGDEALVSWVRTSIGSGPALLALDGPIVCKNATGARPVDRETHRLFGRAHAGCYPANLSRCPRPNRLRRRLEGLGFRADFRLEGPRQAREEGGAVLRRQIEVFPHPATLVLFNLRQIIRYKKGTAAQRGPELRRFQGLLHRSLSRMIPRVRVGEVARGLFRVDPAGLRGAVRKRHEDTLDAIVCALVGWIHWWHGGRCSQELGDLHTGFIIVPKSDGVVGDAWTTS